MTILELRNTFRKDLKTIYPQSEIDSIFSLLLQDLLNMDKATMILEGNKPLKKINIDQFINSLKRLKNKEPIQHIIGSCTFYGLSFKVNSSVLIPRPETEELIAWILKDNLKRNPKKKISILDIGTGSGCIAISLAKNIPNATVWAIDISDKALRIAKENAQLNEVRVQFSKQDILTSKNLPQSFDIIVSNPPYVRLQEKDLMHGNVKQFEPDLALYVTDTNPLVFYDKIADLSLKHVNKEGSLYFEINQYIAKETISLLQEKGFKEVVLRKDLLENDRMIRARM